MSLPRGRSLLSATCGVLALSAGVLIVLGWVTRTAILLRFGPGYSSSALSSGMCLLIGGSALALAAWGAPRRAAWCGLPLIAVAASTLFQTVTGLDLGIDLPQLHAWMQDSNPHPGRMASTSALGFLFLGLGLVTNGITLPGHWVQRLRSMCGIGAFLLGLSGLLAHFVNPEMLFGWYGEITRMAPYSGLGIVVLAVGFLARWQPKATHEDTPQAHRRSIFNTAAIALTVVAAISGTAGFAWQLNGVTQSAQAQLSRAINDRHLVLEEALATAQKKVELSSGSPVLIEAVSTATRPTLDIIVDSMLSNGFSHVAIDGLAGTLSSGGTSVGESAMHVRLKGASTGTLVWHGAYLVRHREAIQGPRGVIGYLRTEQPVNVQTLLAGEIIRWGATFDMALCSEADADHIACFPQRLNPRWFTVPKAVEGQPLPMALALNGHTGVTARLDFRHRQVVAAYAPVGNTGLGMVLKVDSDELYGPARRQFLLMLPGLLVIVLAGLWALRLRLHPLVKELISTRVSAQANEARFIAAMESGLDAFYILRAERDGQGSIIDFRFTYVTVRGAAMVSMTPAQVEGQLLCELIPVNRTGGFFDKYKAVVETGTPLAEEFSIDQPGLVATWISHQVVKLGDDSIAITSRDISERKHAQEAVRKSEELLRLVTDSVPALIAYLGADERYIFINRGGAELYGKSVREVVGRTVLEVVGPQNYRVMQAHIATVQRGQEVTYEREVVRADGNRHVVTSYFPHRDEHGDLFVCALSHDITARKQMEAALAVSQDRLKAVTDNVPALISYIDREHRFRFANLAYRDWLGIDPDTLIGRSLGEVYGDMAYAGILPYLNRALAGELLSYERELPSAGSDDVRHAHVTMTPHRDASGTVVGLYVLMNDITALKKAEKQSARSEERLTLALEGSHLALFDWNLVTNQVFHSAHWSSLLGGPPVETTSEVESLRYLVHPDDLPGVLDKVSSAVKGLSAFYNAEHRVRTVSGDWLWVSSRGRVVERDAVGRALRLSGTNADITEQKRIEAQFQRMAEIDSLTGLPNRALFNDRLDRALARLRRQGGAMALLLLDIDFFKVINDGRGHDVGDAVLQEFARRLTATVRLTDTVARLGGDEFTIILEGLHSEAESQHVARKLVAAMAEEFVHEGQSMRVTASVGLAYVDQPAEAPGLIKRADQALYRAKAAGRNTYCT